MRPWLGVLLAVLGLTAAAVAGGLAIAQTPRASRAALPSTAGPKRRASSRLATARGTFATSYDVSGMFLFGGRPIFLIALSNPPPLGATSPTGRNGLDEVVRAGVNVFRVGPSWRPWTRAEIEQARQWDEAAARRGVYTWINLNGVARASPGWRVAARLRDTVVALLRGPSGRAIALWKGADEPESRHIRPTSLEFAYCRVTSRGMHRWCDGQRPLDRHHLWVTIESAKGGTTGLAAYSKVTDTHGVDVYPITINRGAARTPPNLHLVGIWTKRLASITPNHSVWTTLQICSSSNYVRRTSKYVLPTAWQERYMMYDAIINGARGLAFFGGNNPHCWNARDRAHRWNWIFWNSTLKHLIAEIAASSPLAPALVNPASTRQLSTGDPTTEAISRTDTTPTGTHELWVIAARHGANTRNLTITGLPTTITRGVGYPGGRPVSVVHGSLTDRFRQWQVHVYRFDRGRAAPRPSRSAFPA